jgi:cellulose synthase/poly-beta-1,6-N-acetylglucosamine synthase-like glycosyltransferase
MILAWICACLLLPYAALMIFFRSAWNSVPLQNLSGCPAPQVRVSVIVPARNEAANIGRCLDSLLAQDYPAGLLEIIVIDDQSNDVTFRIMQEYASRGIVAHRLTPGMSGGKKAALTEGIRLATGELILTTDADCTHPPAWVRAMACRYMQDKPVMIAAPVRVTPEHSLVGIFQSLDFLSLQGITAASVHRGFLQMCNGANLAFTADGFRAVDGYMGIDHLPTGDDMLLMEKMAGRFPGRIAYCLSRDTIVDTRPVGSVREFLRQRIRWASKAREYKDGRMFFVLLLVYLLNLAMLMLAVAACVQPPLWTSWLVLLLAKTLIESWFLYPVARFFGSEGLMAWFLPSQPFHILYTVMAGFFGQVKGYRWKGRQWR